jgi:hypothetical protein
MSEKPWFFAELRRRNVYKVAVAYAVVSWLLIQAASILFPTFEAPPWVMKVFIALLLFCFPIALILSWAFELTPEGIKLDSEVAPTELITRKTGRKIVAVTVVPAVIAAGLFVFQFIRARNTVTPRQSEADTISAKSIAVLPFDNLSRDPDNAYFAEGMQDEILTRLAKVADLKVISRTSTQHFKSAHVTLGKILTPRLISGLDGTMKTKQLLGLILLLFTLTGIVLAGDTKIEQALRDLDAQWSKDAGSKDVDKTLSYYADNAMVLLANAPIAATNEAAPNAGLSRTATR